MTPGGLQPNDLLAPMTDETRAALRVLGTLALNAADTDILDIEPLSSNENVYRETPRLLTIPETGRQLRLSRWSVYQLINQRKIASVKVGSRRLVPINEVDRFVAHLVEEDGGQS